VQWKLCGKLLEEIFLGKCSVSKGPVKRLYLHKCYINMLMNLNNCMQNG